MKKSLKDVISVGCSICALFFGSGNIVLPLIIGSSYYSECWLGYSGFLIGAVFLPFIGLISISLCNGDSNEFFKRFFVFLQNSILKILNIKFKSEKDIDFLSDKISLLIRFIILFIMGPLGIVPRCLTVAEGGFHAILNIPNYIFHAILILILWMMVCKKDQVMEMISKILTPIKLTMLVGVVFLCALNLPSNTISGVAVEYPFYSGIMMGYQTLDLIGAIFFGTIVIDYVKKSESLKTKKEIFYFSIKTGVVGSFALAVLYFGFTFIAFGYNASLINVLPEDIFITIANLALGDKAAAAVGLTIVISCLTTAVALISIWVNFITGIFINYRLCNYQFVLVSSLLVTYCFALLGLSGILAVLSPILNFLYPIIIIITLFNLCQDMHLFYKNRK